MGDVIDFFGNLFSSEGFIPRWICGDWTDFHGWFYILSDGLIWLAYFAIPLMLFYYIQKKSSTQFKPVFWWFIFFILLCGLTHIIEVVIFWEPVYRLSAFVKFLTAVVSIVTVIVLIRHLPKALDAKSPDFLEKEVKRQTTQLQALNDKLSLEKLKFEAIMGASTAGMIVFKQNGYIDDSNTISQEIFGYSKQQMDNLHVNDLLPEGFIEFHQEKFTGFMEKPKQKSRRKGVDLNGKRKNGREIPIEIGLSPIQVGNEKMVLATINDIESRKIKEEKKNREIFEIKQLNRKLEKKNDELEDVSYIISHNLRSPINNMKALFQLLKTDEEDQELYLEKVEMLIDKLSLTIDDLNKVVQQGKGDTPAAEQVIFKDVFEQVKAGLQVNIKQNNVQIEAGFSIDSINYPTSFIESYLQNLITNAIKYRKPNVDPEILISTKMAGEFIILSCSDNGQGIDLDKFGNQIFGFAKTFHKHKDARGMGLFMLKKQIERLGGEIKVESEVGVGTSFMLYLKDQA